MSVPFLDPLHFSTFRERVPMADETEAGDEERTIIPIRDWDTDIQCPKCETKKSDEPSIKVIWTDGGSKTVNLVTCEIPEGFEYLHCTCLFCHFEWLMQTADADERAQAAKEAEEDREEEKEKDKPKGHARRIVRGVS